MASLPIAESDVTGLVADLALLAPLASPTLTGSPSLPTGTTAFTTTADNLKANKASPTFTGTVTTPNGAGATDLAAFGQIPTSGAVGGLPKLVFRTGDATPISTSTLADDDTLKWTVGANDRWIVQAFLTFTAANGAGSAATADLKTGWSVPASGAMQWGAFGAITSSFFGYGGSGTALSPNAVRTVAQTFSLGADAVSFGVALTGLYTGGGTSGTVAFQWAQVTTNAATLLLAKNSILLLWRVA